ncbi:MAG: CDP-diacylglycerol--glycerol-3-phosphate 3-phosphatidyltransferase [Lentisphaeria bacterium]|nr:MAG: CDP-diacylglycerol--glycerol-3-phosphate 3-phosphatidyltransferase [Lentisphaeria bacterium]
MRKNLPNILTVSRIIMVMIFVVLATLANHYYLAESCVFPLRLGAYILAILAGTTDLLDGHLARRWNQITDFGALMDPLADKIFVTATMLIAVEYRLMPAWIAVAVLCREFMVTGLRTLAAKKAGGDFGGPVGEAEDGASDGNAGDRGSVLGMGV